MFEDCSIPKENLLGKEGKGFKTAMTSLDVGRLGIAAQALGIAQGAFDQTVEYMKQRKQFGRSLNKFQSLAFEMANMKTEIDAARFVLYNACNTRDRGLNSTVEAASGEAEVLGSRVICSGQGSPVPRRIRIHQGLSCGKDVQRPEDNRDLRGNI